MADKTKIRGITIQIDGDTSNLTKSLKETNSSISETQKGLKDVEKLLKLDPNNTELLKQKQQLLSQQVQQTSQKLSELKKIQDTMDSNAIDKNSSQYQALQREIISTENSLKDLEKAADNANVTLGKISGTATKVAEAAGKVADKTRVLSTAAGAAVAGIAGLAIKAAQDADSLNTLANQSGFTTSQLQAMQYAAEMVDVPMETIVNASRQMTAKLKESEATFNQFGIATRGAGNQLLSTDEIFFRTIQRLGEIDNETERDTVAMRLFGESASKLSGIIDDGGAGLAYYAQKAQELGIILDQDTLNSLNEVNNKIDELKAQFKGELAVAAANALTALQPVFEMVIDAISRILQFIGSLDEGTIKTITIVLSLVAAISPIASIISGIGTAITALANPATVTVALIVALVAATVAFISELVNNWDAVVSWIEGTFKPAWQKAWEGVRNVFSSIFNSLVEIVKAPINGIISMINLAIAGINGLIGLINKLPFANIGAINTIPMLANGGTVGNGGTAIVGEAGAEILTVNNGKATVTPLSGGTQSAVGGNVEVISRISFEGSESQLIRYLQPKLAVETRRLGTSLIN